MASVGWPKRTCWPCAVKEISCPNIPLSVIVFLSFTELQTPLPFPPQTCRVQPHHRHMVSDILRATGHWTPAGWFSRNIYFQFKDNNKGYRLAAESWPEQAEAWHPVPDTAEKKKRQEETPLLPSPSPHKVNTVKQKQRKWC